MPQFNVKQYFRKLEFQTPIRTSRRKIAVHGAQMLSLSHVIRPNFIFQTLNTAKYRSMKSFVLTILDLREQRVKKRAVLM